MIEPSLNYFHATTRGRRHKLSWYEWGSAENDGVLLCVHAINRNGRDFDTLGKVLSAHYRVVCPDLPGRGDSAWLEDPLDYNHDTYLRLIGELLDMLDVRGRTIDWLGTSLGGLLGIRYAAEHPNSVRRLVINDVGTEVPGVVFRNAAESIGKPMWFRDMEHAVLTFKIMTASCGPLTDAEWRNMVSHMIEPAEGGGFVLRFDPKIAVQLKTDGEDGLDLWSEFDALSSRVLLIRGEKSDVLTQENAMAMTQRGPRASLVTIKGTGHFPMLVKSPEIAMVKSFLEAEGPL